METIDTHPRLKWIRISNFRCIETLEWRPSDGVNIVIGGGDSGKSTLLHAIALLFSPTNSVQVFETDYRNRLSAAGFSIEAVVSLPSSVGVADYGQMLWPWEWDGRDAVLPDPQSGDAEKHPVYKLRVRGTEDLELAWEIVQPDEKVIQLSVGLRRTIGIVRLTGDDRNDRDLRLVAGSALDRLLSKGNLKARINQAVSETDLSHALNEEERKALEGLSALFKDAALPHDLDLGLTSSQGISIGALIGVLASQDGIKLPLSCWGAGTRRMAALEIASVTASATNLTVIDEIERGLEPYRLRQLLEKLKTAKRQCFITTHSPIVIASAIDATLWFMDVDGKVGPLEHAKIEKQQKRDPETFLAKLAVIAEGVTEVGFLTFILSNAFTTSHDKYGIRICDGGGSESMLGLLEALSSGGLQFAGFCDDEGRFPTAWQRLKEKLGALLFQWPGGCTEENIIKHVPDDKLLSLAIDSDGESGSRLRTIATRLGISEKDEASIMAACADRGEKYAVLRKTLTSAATGSKEGASDDKQKKEWGKHSQIWFKSEAGGTELAEKMKALGIWPKVEPQILPFINALRKFAGHASLTGGELKL